VLPECTVSSATIFYDFVGAVASFFPLFDLHFLSAFELELSL